MSKLKAVLSQLKIVSEKSKSNLYNMRFLLGLFAVFIHSALAAGPCDADSDNCRAVINGSACFNEFMASGNKNSMLNCLAGTDGAATPQQKVREGVCPN